jgi:hypothetical protein
MRQKHVACATAGLPDGRSARVSATAAEKSKALSRPREVG